MRQTFRSNPLRPYTLPTVVLAGALLIIAGRSDLIPIETVGIPGEAPGLVVIALGFYVLFRSGRRVKDDGRDHDPDAHHALPRDVRDNLERMEDDWDDD